MLDLMPCASLRLAGREEVRHTRQQIRASYIVGKEEWRSSALYFPSGGSSEHETVVLVSCAEGLRRRTVTFFIEDIL